MNKLLHLRKSLLVYLIITVSLLTGWDAFCQDVIITVKDRVTGKAVDGATVIFPNGKSTVTDSQGNLALKERNAKLEISHIAYATASVKVNGGNEVVFLEPKAYDLEEVVVTSVHEKKNKELILPPAKNLNLSMATWGTAAPLSRQIIAVYIPNNDPGPPRMITKIVAEPTDYITIELGKEKTGHEGGKYAPFRVNLYSTDSLGLPGKRFFEDDFTMQLEKGGQYAVVNLGKQQQIPFPEEGLFIVISSFDPDYYKNAGFRGGPALKTVKLKGKSRYANYEKDPYWGDEAKWQKVLWFTKHKATYNVGLEVE